MADSSIRLRYLLRQRHWQTYRTFCIEYDKAAKLVDPSLVSTWPSRAQLHRWLAGELKGLPYPDHCRVLEAMFPGWSAADLFERASSEEKRELLGSGSELDVMSGEKAANVSDLDVFVDFNEEDNRAIARRIRAAENIFFIAHTGYNVMVSQYQAAIRTAVESGACLRVVVSDPDGPLMSQADLVQRLCPSIRQEGEIRDVLKACLRYRKHAIKLGHPVSNVQARVYVGPPSMNLLMVDGWLRVIPYLPLVDAAECPVFQFKFDRDQPSMLVSKYLDSVERVWEDAEKTELDGL
ncbi:MAG TPA: hypothetical protein VFX61_15065 [Micromonosporaceae bacterium]|nr:hypothetical protein [Micromonosporaceae bacterium]